MKQSRPSRPAWFLSLILVSAGAPAENAIYNGSFEAGIDYRVAMGRFFIAGIPAAALDDSTSVHGKYSIRIPYSRPGNDKVPRKDVTGIVFRSSVPLAVEFGKRYWLSAYLKSSHPVRGQLAITAKGVGETGQATLASDNFEIGRRWQHLTLRVDAQKSGDVYWEIAAQTDQPGELWVDALQFSESAPIGYATAHSLEATISSSAIGHLFMGDQVPSIDLTAYNDGDTIMADRRFQITTTTIGGRVVDVTTVSADIPPAGVMRRTVKIPLDRYGAYLMTLSAVDHPEVASKLTISRLPERRDVAADDSAFGAYLTIAPEPLEIMQRLGFRWIGNLTANPGLIYWDRVERNEKEFSWQDDRVALATRMGFRFVFNLEPCRAPGWAKGLPRDIRLEKWISYVEAMVAHYKDQVKYWTISDEIQGAYKEGSYKRACWSNPEEYVPWHRAGYATIKKIDPEAKVIINTSDRFGEALTSLMNADEVDIFAANFYHVPNKLRRAKQVADKWGVGRFWAPGVGIVSESQYREHIPARRRRNVDPQYWQRQARAMTRAVVETLGLGAERFLHYTASYVGNTNLYSVFESDSGLRVTGAQLGSLIWLLDGIDQARQVPGLQGIRELRAYRFDRLDGETVFVLWKNQMPAVTFMLPDAQNIPVSQYDQFANAMEPHSTPDGMPIEIGPDPLFLMIPTDMAGQLEDSMRAWRSAR